MKKQKRMHGILFGRLIIQFIYQGFKIDFNQDEYRITLKCLPENEEDSILGLTIITLEFEDEIVYPGVGWNRHTTRYGQLNCGYTYSKK